MDLLDYSNKNFRKCGEITTALKWGKKSYALNCGFCSKVFIKLHAFTLHIGEKHEQELFGCLDGKSCEELPMDVGKKDLTEFKKENYATAATMEVKFTEMVKDEETATDFQDPLEHPIQNVISKDIPIILEIKEEVETMLDESSYDDNNKYMDKNNEEEGKFDSNDTAINSESDEQDDKKIYDKRITLAIIEGYKKHKVLWDSCDSRLKKPKHKIEAYRSITNCVNKQMRIKLKWNSIQDQIKQLHHKFRSELQNETDAKTKGEDYSPIWYYDKLSFLNTSKNSKLRNKKTEQILANEEPKCELPLPTLTDSENLELIETYKSFPCLWNMEHVEYHITNRRQEAISEMVEEIKTKLNLHLTSDELQKAIHSIRDAYSQETQRKLKCERLKHIFTPLYKFYEHISFLENNVRPFKCDFCKETFNGFIRYKIHKSQHDGSLPFTCPLCNHGFMDVSNCIVHVRAHTGERPYFCEICGQSFGTRSSFNVHKRRHKERPNHICTICSKAFYEKFRLTEHMNAHLNIRNKVCNICDRAFTSSKYLNQHKQIHAEKKKYVCRICGKDFAQAAGLNGHMKSHGTSISGY